MICPPSEPDDVGRFDKTGGRKRITMQWTVLRKCTVHYICPSDWCLAMVTGDRVRVD
jgi:hypothetical protein